MRETDLAVRPEHLAVLTAMTAALAECTQHPSAQPSVQRGLSAAAALLAEGLQLESVVVRASEPHGGDLLAVAGDTVLAVPRSRSAAGRGDVVTLPVRAGNRSLAELVVAGASPEHVPVLRAAAAALALALAPRPHDVTVLEDVERDLDVAADALHDGPVQELVAARLAVDAAARGGDASAARDVVFAALQSVRRALWLMRPRGGDDDGLRGALSQLAARLRDAEWGELDVRVGDSVVLAPVASRLVYRLVQDVALRTPSVTVAASARGADVLVEIVGEIPSDVSQRWNARIGAVGGTLMIEPQRKVTLRIPSVSTDTSAGTPASRPAPCSAVPPPDIEALP